VHVPRILPFDPGITMIAPNATTFPTRLGRAREIASDLLLAVGLIWALPLLLAVIYGVVSLLSRG
jgi:hypothetical protein